MNIFSSLLLLTHWNQLRGYQSSVVAAIGNQIEKMANDSRPVPRTIPHIIAHRKAQNVESLWPNDVTHAVFQCASNLTIYWHQIAAGPLRLCRYESESLPIS
jgi:hypothetical protein